MEKPASKKLYLWIGIAIACLIALGVVVEIVVGRATPIIRGRIQETLSARFKSRVELGAIHVAILGRIQVDGDNLRIYNPNPVVAAGATRPLITVGHFMFRAHLVGLFAKPMHVGRVFVTGLQIELPPKEMRQPQDKEPRGRIKIEVGEIVCDNSRLIIGTAKPGKDPKDFELRHIVLHDFGPNAPWKYEATLSNAIPRGEIHATGSYGPWDNESPGDSPISGHYTFDHADLNTIKGIGGILSSVGDFNGQLDKIGVKGTTDTPDFSIDTANRPLPLHTHFEATVDGTTGDTYLHRIDARLRNSNFTTSGEVINIKGQGHRTTLDVDIPAGRLEDFLELAVKTKPPIMTAIIGMKAKLDIRPGKERVAQKLGMHSAFEITRIHFTNPEFQDKVDMMSERAQGNPKEAKPGAPDVSARMKGTLDTNAGEMNFPGVRFDFPGAQVNLKGIYSMDGENFDFRGVVLTDAKLSEMTASKWKSVLLKPADLLFKRKGGGAEIPVSIDGTQGKPKFGIDFKHKKEDER